MSPSGNTLPNASNDDQQDLLRKLQSLSRASTVAKTIVPKPGIYDFNQQNFTIARRNVTISATGDVILKNIGFTIDLDASDNIVIENIAFRSNGKFDSAARDAIKLEHRGPAPASTAGSVSVRITRCSFDGYFDIAIDSDFQSGRPLVNGTIDRCLFFESRPGKPNATVVQNDRTIRKFANRGAINIASVAGGSGGALFTISNNVFIDVWRRSPRVAVGNKAFIYNNLLFRWGKGNTDDNGEGTDEWVGMAIDNNALAVIERNRFIPWQNKLVANKTINIDPAPATAATVDIGNPDEHVIPPIPDRTNEFDGANGTTAAMPAGLPPTIGIQHIDVSAWYEAAGLAAPPVPATLTNTDWIALVNAAGPDFGRSAITQKLRDVLQNATSPPH
jgi:hypothetical protein